MREDPIARASLRARRRQLLCSAAAALLCATAPAGAAAPEPEDCDVQVRRVCCSTSNFVLHMGCRKTQKIPLDLGPGDDFEIFVDGEAVAGSPEALRLRPDRSHVVMVKRAGHRPEMVVLRSRLERGELRLSPSTIALRLEPRADRRRLSIEIGTSPDES